MNQSKQDGDAHIAIVLILVVVLIGTLGFVFWQNFVKKDPATDTAQTSSSSNKPAQSTPIVTTKTFTIDSISFSTPKSWMQEGNSMQSHSLIEIVNYCQGRS